MKNVHLPSLLYFLLLTLFFSCSDDDSLAEKNMDAAFKADIQNINAGETVQFTDMSIGNISKWNWTFKGGTPPTSSLQNPEVTFNASGTYAVSLHISGSGQSSSISNEEFIVVNAPEIQVDFKANKTSAREGENITFTDMSSGNPNSWKWEFIPSNGASFISEEQNPTVAFEDPGTYTVKLTASNGDKSSQGVKNDYLAIIDATSVEANFTADKTNTYTGASVAYTDTSVGTATSWNWTFEGGTPATSNEQNPTVVYNTSGRYKVILTASNSEKSSLVEKENYIMVIPGESLAAFYPLNGNANDIGPNAVTTNVAGSIDYTGANRNGMENTTATFTGSSAIIASNNAAMNFATSDYSVGLWVKTDNTTKMMLWQESGANGPGDNQTWLRLGDNTSDRLLRFATEDSGGGAILNVGAAEVPTGVADNNWHFLVCVRQGGLTKVYVDGTLSKEMSKTVTKEVSNGQDFKIGAQETSPGELGNYYQGAIDDIVIYNKALTETEIATLYGL
ncbi:PKD domain-containing protein [Galbibacter sp. PAP.153]|uniref:PKD domain-containing protein n=1 Tax=Galbibacter sp. PAP.153 TaxID=3104623 RepID=UPI0030088BFA